MTALITELIDKEDNSEIIRNRVADILKANVIKQKELAAIAGKDPNKWDFDVYTEAVKPWEVDVDKDGNPNKDLKIGVVNVTLDDGNLSQGGSDEIRSQNSKLTINLDCYGFKPATYSTDSGAIVKSGDLHSTLEAERIARLVRNIIMSGYYKYLGFEKTENVEKIVKTRKIISYRKFQPRPESDTFCNVIGIRLVLSVESYETSPQVILVQMETLTADVLNDNGEVILNYEENN